MAGDQFATCLVEDVAAPIANAIVGGPFGSNLVSRDYVFRGVPVIRGANMASGRWISGPFVHVTAAKAASLSANIARPGDVVVTQRGTLGQVAIVPSTGAPAYLLSQSQMKVTIDTRIYNEIFLYYVLLSPDQQIYIHQNAITVGVPHTNLRMLRRTRIPLPPLPEQRAIAHVLGAIDDKIDLNRRMAATLEEMARALFTSWFVRFDPVRAKMAGQPTGLPAHIEALFPDALVDSELGEVPEGWGVGPLDSVARFLNGLALQKYPAGDGTTLPVIKIAQLKAMTTDSADRCSADLPLEYVVSDGDLLFSWSGSLEVALWTAGSGALNQHLFKVTSNGHPEWFVRHALLAHLPSFRAIAASKATTMGHIQRGHLTEALVALPPADVMQAASLVLGSTEVRLSALGVENRSLTTLRDTLLPKLVSGEVRITDPEAFLRRAGLDTAA